MRFNTYTVSKPNLSCLTECEISNILSLMCGLSSSSRPATSPYGLYQITRRSRNRVLTFLVALPPGVDLRLLRELSSEKSPFCQLFTRLLSYENGVTEPSLSTTLEELPDTYVALPLGTPPRRASASSSRPGTKSAGISGKSQSA